MEKTRPRRRWIRFRLRTLLIVVTVSSVPVCWAAWNLDQGRRRQATVSWIQENGGQVIFHSFYKPDKRSWWEKITDQWFGERVRLAGLQNAKNVSDLSPFRDLKSLEDLALSNTPVSDLSPLAELKNLNELYLEGTQVHDLSPLAEMENLEMIWLDSTPVLDLSPLATLTNLKWLKLRNTLVSEQQVQELEKALPNCDIVYSKRKE
jgi:hypothetical protein